MVKVAFRGRPRATLAAPFLGALAALIFGAVACEKVNHENIDRWKRTEKGPDKLVDAVGDDSHDADLRAHAAQNLVQLGNGPAVLEALEEMEAAERAEVLTALGPRLWDDARLDGDLTVPSPNQTAAKDFLYELRKFADDINRDRIDDYLIEWFTGGYYEGRASLGIASSDIVMRAIGAKAAPRLLESARGVLARPADSEGKRPLLGQHLLAALALTGDAEAVGFVLDCIDKTDADPGLPDRAMKALYSAFVRPVGVDPVDGRALLPVLERLAQIIRDPRSPGQRANDAVDLVAAVGMPECLPVFVNLMSASHRSVAYQWMVAQRAIRCGGPDATLPVIEALPHGATYERAILERYLWKEILSAGTSKKIASAAVTLLDSDNEISAASGIELLGALATAETASDYAGKINRLRKDSRRLRGWWGKQEKVPANKRRGDPTVGDIATEVARRLEDLAE